MAESGYNFEVCGHKMPDLECSICLNLLKEAKELPCTHNTCAVCLFRWEEEQMRQKGYVTVIKFDRI